MLRFLAILAMSLSACAQGQAQSTNDEIHLRATVQAVVPLTKFSGQVTAIDVDPRFALTLRIESAVPVVANFSEGAVVALAIHSPSLLFEGESPNGKTYDFAVHRTMEDGKARFVGLTCTVVGQDVRRVPAVDVSAPNRVLEQGASNVCSIDFRNIRMFGENADWSADLKNGKYERKSHSAYESTKLDHVFCSDYKRGGGQHAMVMTDWTDCGGSCMRTGVVQLFAIRAAHPVITQQFVYDSHATGTGATFDEKSLTLTITGRSDDGSPNCCPKSFDVVTYRWQEGHFEQRSYKRVPAPSTQSVEGDTKPHIPR
jgi:hypothetical protein